MPVGLRRRDREVGIPDDDVGINGLMLHYDGMQWSTVQLATTRNLFAIRLSNPVLRRRHFFRGEHTENGEKELVWLAPDGQEMNEQRWHDAPDRLRQHDEPQ